MTNNSRPHFEEARLKSTPDEADLVVIDFKTDYMPPSVQVWMNENEFFMAESCARQTWVGRSEQFKDFPFKDLEGTKNVKILQGADAYNHLLYVSSGLDSAKMGETLIKGQINKKWVAFKEKHTEVDEDGKETRGVGYEKYAKPLEKIMAHLTADFRTIYDVVLKNCKSQEHHLMLRDLVGQEKGDSILLVADLARYGDLTKYSRGIMTLCTNKSMTPKDIFVFHPDKETARRVFNEVKKIVNKCRPEIYVELLSWDSFSDALEISDQVYIDTKMGDYPDADSKIRELWSDRINPSITLSHMRGDPLNNREMSNKDWLDWASDLDEYFSPEQIREYQNFIKEHNAKIITLARVARAECAKARLENGSLSKSALRKFIEDAGAEEKAANNIQNISSDSAQDTKSCIPS